LSTTALVRRLALALGVEPPYLPWVPVWMLRAAGRALGRRATVERLTQSLEIDSSFLKARLGWTPPFAGEDGFADMARWFNAPPPPRR